MANNSIKEYLKNDGENLKIGVMLEDDIEKITFKQNKYVMDFEPNKLINSCSNKKFKGFICTSKESNISELEKEVSFIAAQIRNEEVNLYRITSNSDYVENWICKPKRNNKCNYKLKNKISVENFQENM